MSTKIQTIDGLPVLDATEPLWLDVIRQDIDEHKRRDPENCALAQACKRDLHAIEARAYLSRLYIRYEGSDHWLRYMLPEVVRSEVAAFDRGGGFSEGTYRLPPLPLIRRSGAPGQGGQQRGRKPNPDKIARPTHRIVHGVRAHSPLEGGAMEQLPFKKD